MLPNAPVHVSVRVLSSRSAATACAASRMLARSLATAGTSLAPCTPSRCTCTQTHARTQQGRHWHPAPRHVEPRASHGAPRTRSAGFRICTATRAHAGTGTARGCDTHRHRLTARGVAASYRGSSAAALAPRGVAASYRCPSPAALAPPGGVRAGGRRGASAAARSALAVS